MVDEFSIRTNETEEEYIVRACELGLSRGMTWLNIADIINRETERNSDESTYRRRYKAYKMGYKAATKSETRETEKDKNNELFSLFEAKIGIQKEKYKLSDERVQINEYIRRLAREETLKEIGLAAAEKMNSKKMLSPILPIRNDGPNSAELLISDWHLGLFFKNYFNEYNIYWMWYIYIY